MTAAAPTKLCNIAISSGIPVISTLRAKVMPMRAPIAIATAMMPKASNPADFVASHRVAASAIAMPTMPYLLPMTAVSCLDNPARARMNSRPATM